MVLNFDIEGMIDGQMVTRMFQIDGSVDTYESIKAEIAEVFDDENYYVLEQLYEDGMTLYFEGPDHQEMLKLLVSVVQYLDDKEDYLPYSIYDYLNIMSDRGMVFDNLGDFEYTIEEELYLYGSDDELEDIMASILGLDSTSDEVELICDLLDELGYEYTWNLLEERYGVYYCEEASVYYSFN